jgi:MFS family permease
MLKKVIHASKNTFRALKSRNYRLFFFGQGISLIGTWMQGIAIGWLVYRLTNSPLMLGVVGFSGQIFTFAFAPFAGVAADRFDRKNAQYVTQSLSMIQALILAALVLTGTIQVWHLIVLSAALGIINAFDIPIRQAFVVEMVEHKEDLSNAIALNSSMVNGARLLGPAIAGIIIALMGEGLCFLLNGLSYIAVLLSLFMMKIKQKPLVVHKTHPLIELKEGMLYAFGNMPIRSILLLLSLVSLIGMPYALLMPVFARDLLHGGPQTLGFLVGASGFGALIGALFLASRKSVVGLEKLLVAASMLFGIALIVFSYSSLLWLSMLVLFFAGFGMIVNMASSNTILQTVVEDNMRGRVMSLYTMAFVGMAPFGSLYAGFASTHIGPRMAVTLGGVGCIIGAGLFSIILPEFKERVHHRYRKLGIIKEVAIGIQMATDLTRPPEEK